MSVKQSFDRIQNMIVDTTEERLDQFWVWIVYMRNNLIENDQEKDQENDLYELIGTPDYVVSDFHVTTRRIKEEASSKYTSDKRWVS